MPAGSRDEGRDRISHSRRTAPLSLPIGRLAVQEDMCGISVLLLTNGLAANEADLRRMMDAIRHRGPDDSGTYVSGSVGLGFRRLSILDLSPTGHQPMSSPEGDCTIVFNGEIYNFIELRRQLIGLGYQFRSTGDTEVLLNAYRAWGSQCLERLNGMWSFIIHDKRRNVLFGARDRFGIKPLYRCRTERGFVFASEIKSILASGFIRPETNWRAASAFLLEQRLDETTETFYAGVEQIPAGSAFELAVDGRLRTWQYWDIGPEEPDHSGDPATEFAELFEDAIRLHMRSDVPVGVHLSGGLDSTAIICASARIRQAQQASGDLLAFSYMTPEFDETRYVEDTIDLTKARLNRLRTSPEELWSRLEQVLSFQDEPVHSITAVVGFELMRLAAENGIKVILNGQGADETIGGYPSYFRAYWHTLLKQRGLASAWREMRRHSQNHGGVLLHLFARQLKYWLQCRLAGHPTYRRLALRRHRARLTGNDWFSSDLVSQMPDSAPPIGDDLSAALIDSVRRAPLPLYLRVEDRNSMAHSVEVRVPFLDHRLVSLAFSLPLDWHLRGPWNKFVLREAMRGRIPESVRTRQDKMGFPTPSRKWFAGKLQGPLRSILLDRSTRDRGVFNLPAIERDLNRHAGGEVNLSAELFNLAQFEVWCRGLPSPARDQKGPPMI